MTDSTDPIDWPQPLRWVRQNLDPSVGHDAALISRAAIYETPPHGLASFSLEDGSVNWISEPTGPLLGATDDIVLTHAPGDSTVLMGISPQDGSALWRMDVEGQLERPSSDTPSGARALTLQGSPWVQMSVREDGGYRIYRASVGANGQLGELQMSPGGRMVGWNGQAYAATGPDLFLFDGRNEQRVDIGQTIFRVSVGFDDLLTLFPPGSGNHLVFDAAAGAILGEVPSPSTAVHALRTGTSVFLDSGGHVVCRAVPGLQEQWRLDVSDLRPPQTALARLLPCARGGGPRKADRCHDRPVCHSGHVQGAPPRCGRRPRTPPHPKPPPVCGAHGTMSVKVARSNTPAPKSA